MKTNATMKKLSLIILLFVSFFGFSQTPKKNRQAKYIAIDQYYYGINTYHDTLSFFTYEIPDTLLKLPITNISYANGLKTAYNFDSISAEARVRINDVVFPNRDI